MLVKVIKCDAWYWYRNCIGDIFEVTEVGNANPYNINDGFAYKTVDRVKCIRSNGYLQGKDVRVLTPDDILLIRKQEFEKLIRNKKSVNSLIISVS